MLIFIICARVEACNRVIKTECLLVYFQTDIYAENNDLMRLLTN